MSIRSQHLLFFAWCIFGAGIRALPHSTVLNNPSSGTDYFIPLIGAWAIHCQVPIHSLASAQVLMIPKQSSSPATVNRLCRIYGSYIQQHYSVAETNECWILLTNNLPHVAALTNEPKTK